MTPQQALEEARTLLVVAGFEPTHEQVQHVAISLLRTWRDGHAAGEETVLESVANAVTKAKIDGVVARNRR